MAQNTIEFSTAESLTLTKDMSNIKATKKNDQGYYQGVIVGALQALNAKRELYVYNQKVVDVLLNHSIMARRLRDGSLYIEVTHPGKWDEMHNKLSKADFRRRGLDIDLRYVCGHISGLRVDKYPTPVKGQPKPVYLIRADIKPIGPYAKLLEDSITTDAINTAFSIRSFVIPRTIGGTVWKTIAEVTTFDMVLQPGMQGIADKMSWADLPNELVSSNEDLAELATSLENFSNIEESLESNLEYLNKEIYCDEETGVCALLASPTSLK